MIIAVKHQHITPNAGWVFKFVYVDGCVACLCFSNMASCLVLETLGLVFCVFSLGCCEFGCQCQCSHSLKRLISEITCYMSGLTHSRKFLHDISLFVACSTNVWSDISNNITTILVLLYYCTVVQQY